MKFMTTDYSIHEDAAALLSFPRSLYDLLNQHYMEYAGQRYATQKTLVINGWALICKFTLKTKVMEVNER